MDASSLLVFFVVARTIQFAIERGLSLLNRQFYLKPENQKLARENLKISDADWQKTLDYSTARFRFGMVWSFISFLITIIALSSGILGFFEGLAQTPDSPIWTGLKFFGLLGAAMFLMGIPSELYSTFVIEQKFGFNRQTVRGFILDKIKGIVIAAIMGGGVLAMVLSIMQRMGSNWWIYAWIALTVFSLFTAWIFPTVLAPLFNKFSALKDGELKQKIEDLAQKIGFKSAGISIMDASKRSSHGNAYFTGVFGAKKIVLFDTLVESMEPKEVVAVLAHELGHFKLHHVRWGLIRSVITSGIMFFLLSQFLPLPEFYLGFGLSGVSNYGALIVFGLWFGLVDFYLQPIESSISRKNEFAADNFAKQNLGTSADLSTALLKLREKSFVMPVSHPIFSMIYHSHPPLLSRLAAMKD